MRTRDGVRLDADIWRPEGPGPYPVLLMRQPYGRSIASTVVYAHPSWYARHGYIVVIQDVRGRGTSDGDFRIFAQEFADGYDTVEWASHLPGSTGAVGMYGFSYQAASQLLAASSGHPALKTICPAMGLTIPTPTWVMRAARFACSPASAGGLQLASEAARRAGDVEGHQALVAAARTPPLHEALPAMPGVMQRYGHYGHYVDWITHPQPGGLWDLISPRHYARQLKLPALHIGGWFDGILTGTLAGYRDLAGRRDAGPQYLVVGPWVHMPWATKVGEIEFGAAAGNQIDHVQLRWFDQFLKGVDTGLLKEKPVRLFEMGGTWRSFAVWPDENKRVLFLASGGRAGLDVRDGRLLETPTKIGEDAIVFDPWRPTPSVGGHAAYPMGPTDRRTVDARSDVLTYTTPVLTSDLHLAGDVAAELFVTVRPTELRSFRRIVRGAPRRARLQPHRGLRTDRRRALAGRGCDACDLRQARARLGPAPLRRCRQFSRASRQPRRWLARGHRTPDRSADHHRLPAPRGGQAVARVAARRAAAVKVLVIRAHPLDDSFNAALHRVVLEGLKIGGHEIDNLDLYAETFQPVLSAEERGTITT